MNIKMPNIISRNADIGIDLGTSNILICDKNQGIVLDEPSIIAADAKTGRIVATGKHARTMLGRNPEDLLVIKPMKDGVISDFESSQQLISLFLKKVFSKKNILVKPRVVIGAPSGITEVEKRALHDTCETIGSREIYIIEESRAAALGAGLPVNEPRGSMVMDLGGGTSEIAIVSLGGVVESRLVRIGGERLDARIQKYIYDNYNCSIGASTAENIKNTLTDLSTRPSKKTMSLYAMDNSSGLPRKIEISNRDVKEAIQNPIIKIIEEAKSALDSIPPELYCDILEYGIVLTGGLALMKGIDQFISKTINFPVICAENPLQSVAIGCGMFLENIDKTKKYR